MLSQLTRRLHRFLELAAPKIEHALMTSYVVTRFTLILSCHLLLSLTMLLQVQALELPHLVLPLSLTILARCQPSKKIGFLSATEGKLPMCSHALAVVAVAMRLLYGLGNDEQETHEEHSKVIKLLHANRNRLVTDGWGFLTQMEISPSCSAVYASCETQQAQGSLETIHTRKRRRI